MVATETKFYSTVIATTNAGAEALLTCEGLEALLVPSDGRLDISGDVINLALHQNPGSGRDLGAA